MCNPSPQGRCQGDAAKAVASKAALFEKTFDDFKKKVGEKKAAEIVSHFSTSDRDFSRNSQEVCNALRAVNEAKAFLYATPSAQKNPADAAKKISELESSLSPLQRQILKETDARTRRTGKFLSKFQEIAREDAKSHPDEPSIATARLMADSGFFRAKYQMEANLDQAYKEKLSKALDETPGPEQAEVRGRFLYKSIDDKRALTDACQYARDDAKNAIQKDIEKNSATYESSIEKHKLSFTKHSDGIFRITDRFQVKAKSREEASDRAKGSVNLDSVKYTIVEYDSNEYIVYTSYDYQGGESLEDAKKFHSKVWKGTPDARNSKLQESLTPRS